MIYIYVEINIRLYQETNNFHIPIIIETWIGTYDKKKEGAYRRWIACLLQDTASTVSMIPMLAIKSQQVFTLLGR